MSINEYTQKINTNTPGLLIILIDQSSSMANEYGNSNKMTVATDALNQVIYELRAASQDGPEILDKLYIGVIGYGKTVDALLGGSISKIKAIKKESKAITRDIGASEMQMPIYLVPKAANGTPMDKAFNKAYDAAYGWVKQNPDNFPPIVINITDGVPNDLQHEGNGEITRGAAIKLMSLGTNFGKLLLWNAHFGDSNVGESLLPKTKAELKDKYAQYLFDFTSEIPAPLLENARKSGFNPQPGAKGLVFNSSAEFLLKFINFGSSKFV